VDSGNPWLAVASGFTTALFWGLDAYFLHSERRFRGLYDRVRAKNRAVPELSMDPTDGIENPVSGRSSWIESAKRPAVKWLYIGLLASGVAVAVLVAFVPTATDEQVAPTPSLPSPGQSPDPSATIPIDPSPENSGGASYGVERTPEVTPTVAPSPT
jgi:hypothetical protein